MAVPLSPGGVGNPRYKSRKLNRVQGLEALLKLLIRVAGLLKGPPCPGRGKVHFMSFCSPWSQVRRLQPGVGGGDCGVGVGVAGREWECNWWWSFFTIPGERSMKWRLKRDSETVSSSFRETEAKCREGTYAKASRMTRGLDPQAQAIASARGSWRQCQGAVHEGSAGRTMNPCRAMQGDGGNSLLEVVCILKMNKHL